MDTAVSRAQLPGSARELNRHCFCITLDQAALRRAIEEDLGSAYLFDLLHERCPFVFSAHPVFVNAARIAQMEEVVRAVEAVVALPAWQQKVLATAPAVARQHSGNTRGIFLGYDFHLNDGNPGLIEINTNAGGAMLNVMLAKAQRTCCPELAALPGGAHSGELLEQKLAEMFATEWQLAGMGRALEVIAIVDEAPPQQYLYPEFLLFQRLLHRQGYRVVIAAPEELEYSGGALWHHGVRIDFVYNRLTDFLLEQQSSATLRAAYLDGAAVITPGPREHALYANKRNLALLSNRAELAALGVPPAVQDVLVAGIPHTEVVDPGQAARLWAERRQLFFKPAGGYGSRAAYRGDKLTKRVWEEILAGDYVAQALVQPGERRLSDALPGDVLKFDLRNYVYRAEIQWTAARLYQGQTTNFRTPKGGFAPVYVEPVPRA